MSKTRSTTRARRLNGIILVRRRRRFIDTHLHRVMKLESLKFCLRPLRQTVDERNYRTWW